MDYIFFDLELNNVYRKGKLANIKKGKKHLTQTCPQEIIEIGAVKVDENLNLIDTFRIFVKPKIFWFINPEIVKLTNITDENLNYGFEFDKAIEIFESWMGNDFYLCSWGNDVRDLKRNFKIHNMSDIRWANHYIDIQKHYMRIINPNNKLQPSLKSAILKFNIETDRDNHKALNDAFHTFEVCKHLNLNYGINVIKETVEKQNKEYLNLLKNKKFDKRIKCPSCGKFMKITVQPFDFKKEIGTIGHCIKCDVFCRKSKKWSYDENNNIILGDNYRIKKLTPSTHNFFLEISNKRAK